MGIEPKSVTTWITSRTDRPTRRRNNDLPQKEYIKHQDIDLIAAVHGSHYNYGQDNKKRNHTDYVSLQTTTQKSIPARYLQSNGTHCLTRRSKCQEFYLELPKKFSHFNSDRASQEVPDAVLTINGITIPSFSAADTNPNPISKT